MSQLLYNLSLGLLILSGINAGSIGLRNVDLIKEFNKNTFKNENFVKFLYILIGIAAFLVILLSIYSKVIKNQIELIWPKFNYQNEAHHICTNDEDGDASCRAAGYGNKCVQQTCVTI